MQCYSWTGQMIARGSFIKGASTMPCANDGLLKFWWKPKNHQKQDFLNLMWGPETGSGHPVFTRAAPRRRPSSLTPAALLCGLLALPFTTQAPKHGAEIAFPPLTHSPARWSLFCFSIALEQGNKPVKRSSVQEERTIFFLLPFLRSRGCCRRF